MSTYTGTETTAIKAGGMPSAPTFCEIIDVIWDDKYDPDAPLLLEGLVGTFVGCIPARLSDAAKGYVAIADDRLTYVSQTGNFTAALTITGATSGATATLVYDEDAGTTGRLTVKDVVGTFVTGEVVTDTSTGSATLAVVKPCVRVYVVNTTNKVFDECAKDVDLSGVLVRLPVLTQ